MVIKEATGNCAMAILINIILLLVFEKYYPNKIILLKENFIVVITLLIIFCILCIYTNWVHANRELSFIKSTLVEYNNRKEKP
jgi:hypothetical protein